MGIACSHIWRYGVSRYGGEKVVLRSNLVKVIKGKEFIDLSKQVIDFGDDYVDRGYRSCAFAVNHNGVVYGNTSDNLGAAVFGRCFASRTKNGEDVNMFSGYDSWLRDNQKLFIETYRSLFIDYAADFDFREGQHVDVYWENMAIALFPHVKRKLRLMAVRDLFLSGKWREDVWQIFMTRIKMKLHEFAKNGKMPRCIGDLGVSASLVGAEITDWIKKYMEEKPFCHGVNRCHFVKSVSHSKLCEVFGDMSINVHDDYSVVAYVFSDDSIFNICFREEGIFKQLVLCVDISKCDMSHTRSLFHLLRDMFETNGLLQRLIDQCIGEVCMFGVDRSKKIVLKLLDYILLSGSTLTTAINTLANFIIFLCVCLEQPKSGSQLMLAVEKCGYVVTAGNNVAECPSQQQFLKHSPVRLRDGSTTPMLNLGPYFRRFGMTKSGDFEGPKEMSFHDRACALESAVLNGMFGDGVTYGIKNPFLDFMRSRFNVQLTGKHEKMLSSKVKDMLQYMVKPNESQLFDITDEALFERYIVGSEINGNPVTMLDVDQLYIDVRKLRYGTNLDNPIVHEILRLDYGLGRAD